METNNENEHDNEIENFDSLFSTARINKILLHCGSDWCVCVCVCVYMHAIRFN